MRKVILILAALGMSFSIMAQDKFVTTAREAITKQNFDEAKENIDKAMANPETNGKPKTIFTKVQVYMELQKVDKFKASSPYREAAQALFKLIDLKPDYEKSAVDQYCLIVATYYYNDGVRTNNDKKNYVDAIDLIKNVITIHDLGGGKRFEKLNNPLIDTMVANSYMIIANANFYLSKYDEAVPLLVKVKNNPITRSPSEYEILIDTYNRLKNSTEALATIQEARKNFPDDVTIRNYEINYYISTGKQDEIIKKLEEAAAKEPTNGDIQFNLATTYLGMASPKDGPKPANAAELLGKAETAFGHAVEIAPSNALYNYNFGVMYFNQAVEFNNAMNAITGTSDADQKKYDGLKEQRDGLFTKSTPYFEKAYSELSKNEKDLRGDDKQTYKSTLMSLKEVYARQNKLDKSAEMKHKLETLQ